MRSCNTGSLVQALCDDLGRWDEGKGGRLKGRGYNIITADSLCLMQKHNIVKIKKTKNLKKEKYTERKIKISKQF